MNKIGTTSTGAVVVEMSCEEFNALRKLSVAQEPEEKRELQENSMSISELVEYITPIREAF